jgi:peptidylprolyl isomerase
MTRKKLTTVIAILLVGISLLIWMQWKGISLQEVAGLGGRQPAAAKAGGTAGDAPDKETAPAKSPAGPEPELLFEQVRLLLANLAPEKRRHIIEDQQRFRQFVEQEARNESLLAAARDNRLEDDANVRFLRQRAADNVVRELYMKRLIESKIPEDFPSEDQIRQYYEKNRDQFRVGERVQVWQIFLPFTDKTGESDVKGLESKAEVIVKDIRTGKVSFAEAAYTYSAHESSRSNGGYMGLIKIGDLRPGIDKALEGLEEGRVSAPVKTDEGLHILKKGTTVPGREFALEQVRGQIRRHLLNQAAQQLKQAVYDQAAKSYPVDLKDSKTEEWRLRLRTDWTERQQ